MIPRSELYYFVPGQVILHIEHPVGTTPGVLENAVEDLLNKVKAPWVWVDPGIQRFRVVTFPMLRSEKGEEISLVLTQFDVPNITLYEQQVYMNQDKLINQLFDIYTQLDTNSSFYSLHDGLTLIAISPNWLTSGSPHLPGVGGPGAWPVPAEPPKNNQEEISFPEIPDSRDFINSLAGKMVEVAILDTAPSEKDIQEAFNIWPEHFLLKKLLGDGEMLEIDRYAFSEWENIEHFSAMAHRYEMPDHGLFVAGIINTIAPQAQLKLYEVLNRCGIGSYESIYTGLKKVLLDLETPNFGSNTRLIINLSLVLNMPLVDPKTKMYIQKDPGIADRYKTLQERGYIERMSRSIQEILAQLVKLKNVLVVAAAGNDASPGVKHPWARYPAAGAGVIGVGALPKNSWDQDTESHRSATYSNICDQPPYEGYVTLGGEPGVGNGVRSIYISQKFPADLGSNNVNYPAQKPLPGYLRGPRDYSPDLGDITYRKNDTGWAWWAGTSFAAPIISGLLAADNNWTNPLNALTFLNSASHSHTQHMNQKVILVKQKHP